MQALGKSGGGSLALRFRPAQPEAVAEALKMIRDASAAKETRRQLIEICWARFISPNSWESCETL